MKQALLALLIASASATAATIPFDVTMPFDNKIAYVPEDANGMVKGLNIRKTPSTTAPRLMVKEASITDFHTPVNEFAVWSSAKATDSFYPVLFDYPAPIVGERAGWFEVMGIGAKRSNGWVSGKLAKATAMTSPMKDLAENESAVIIDRGGEGTYVVYCETNEMDGDATFSVGRLQGDVVIFPYGLYVSSLETVEKGTTPTLTRNEYGYCLNVPRNMADEYGMPFIKEFPKAFIDKVISSASEYSRARVMGVVPQMGIMMF